jgi:hypothetical protein
MATRTCLFCQRSGHAKITKEHVWPQWVAALMPGESKTVPNTLRSTEVESVKNWKGGGYGLQVNDVCAHCNSGWMSDLENAIRPVLGPLIEGSTDARPITLSDQALITRWALKLAIMTDATARKQKRFFTSRERLRVREGQNEPRGLYFNVFLGMYGDPQMGLESFYYTFPLPMSAIGQPTVLTVARRAVFTARIGKIVLQGLFHHLGEAGPIRLPVNLSWNRFAYVVHPFTPNLDWPPEPLPYAGFVDLKNRWSVDPDHPEVLEEIMFGKRDAPMQEPDSADKP